MKRKSFLLSILAVLAISVTMTSCYEENDGTPNSTLANIMIVNSVPGSNGLDFYLDNVRQNNAGINYGTNSAYYQALTGIRNLKLNRAQTATNLVDMDKDLSLNGAYSVIALDTAGSVQSLILEDDLSEPVLGKAHVRFVHASHNSGAIDIVNLADTSVLFSNMTFKKFTAFTPVDAGAYSLGYRAVGDSNITSLPTPVNLGNRQIYTVIASGFNTDTSGTAVTSLNIQLINN